MDQPTYTPVQQIVERSGTLLFSFQDPDQAGRLGQYPGGDDHPLFVPLRVRHHCQEECGGIAA